MLGLNKLWAAVARLADNLNALADTTAEVNQGVRARLQLNGPDEAPQLPGEVIDQGEEAPANGRGRKRSKQTV